MKTHMLVGVYTLSGQCGVAMRSRSDAMRGG